MSQHAKHCHETAIEEKLVGVCREEIARDQETCHRGDPASAAMLPRHNVRPFLTACDADDKAVNTAGFGSRERNRESKPAHQRHKYALQVCLA